VFPILFQVGDFRFYTSFFTLPLVSLIFVVFGWKRLKKIGYRDDQIGEIMLLIFLSWALFSRLYLVGKVPFSKLIYVWQGGHSMILGIMGPMVFTLIYLLLRKKKIPEFFDSIVPVIALSLALHRIFVCFPEGCCFGRPFKLGIKFAEGSPAYLYFGSKPIHPTQIYEGIFMGLTFFLLEKIRFKEGGDKTLFFLFMLSLMRLLIDNLRGDINEFIIKFEIFELRGITLWQVLSIFLFLCGVFWLRIIQRPPKS